MARTTLRQDQVRGRGSTIDDTLDPPDHDTNAQTLQDTLDHFASQFTKITGKDEWEEAPAQTIEYLATQQGLVPRTIVVTRDSEGRVETYTVGTDPTWTLSRDSEGRVSSLTNGIYLRTINRDSEGQVTSVVVTVL